MPQVLPLHPAPESDQVAPRFWKSLLTVAVKACVPYPDGTEVLAGETLTEIGSAVPLMERKAAMPAPQLSEPPRDALADAVPAVVCNWSSTISLVFGGAGEDSSMV